MKFKNFLKKIQEETVVGDIASVEKKLDLTRRHEKHVNNGKKCKAHKRVNCEECVNEEHYN